MVKVRGQSTNRKTVKQTEKMACASVGDVSSATLPSCKVTRVIRKGITSEATCRSNLSRPVEFKSIPQLRILDAWHRWRNTSHVFVTRDFLGHFQPSVNCVPVRILTLDFASWPSNSTKKAYKTRDYDIGVQFSFHHSEWGPVCITSLYPKWKPLRIDWRGSITSKRDGLFNPRLEGQRWKLKGLGRLRFFFVSAKASLPISLSPFPFLFLSLPLPFPSSSSPFDLSFALWNRKAFSLSILRFLCPPTLPLCPRTQNLSIVRRAITLHAGKSCEAFTWLWSKISWDIWQISCEIGDYWRRSRRKLWKKLDSASRFESFFSFSLKHWRSAGKMVRQYACTGASVFDRRQKFCESAARLDGLLNLR